MMNRVRVTLRGITVREGKRLRVIQVTPRVSPLSGRPS